jgi:hypothetical protein
LSDFQQIYGDFIDTVTTTTSQEDWFAIVEINRKET